MLINKSFTPFPILETERLLLREITSADSPELFELLGDSEVAKFEIFHPLKSEDDVHKCIERYKNEIENNVEITWGIIFKETNRLIGTCCLGSFEEDARRAELGYDVMQSEWGKGFATEALEAIIDFGFNHVNLNRIEATITPGNIASVKVLEKLNFIHEGVVRERDLIKGKLEDGIIMSLLKREYKG